ncbi:MAG: hypothetical protein JWO63_2340 [Frankiales bacterium]|nr:hypothetical protein [Frankiales bacterium]
MTEAVSKVGSPTLVRELAGAWRRTRLILPDGSGDADATTVTWLQSTSLYVDLRQPADRPAFGGATDGDSGGFSGEADLSQRQRDWIAGQEGFAGSLNKAGAVFSWRRELDLRPPGAFADEGTLAYQGEVLVEEGIHQPYAEHWTRVDAGNSPRWGVRVSGDGGQLGLLFRVGDWFGWAHGPGGPQSAESGSPWARTEISLGLISNGEWRIVRSSRPLREGTVFTPRVTGSVVMTSGVSPQGEQIEQQWDLLWSEGEI